jgi:hypothetical protein
MRWDVSSGTCKIRAYKGKNAKKKKKVSKQIGGD